MFAQVVKNIIRRELLNNSHGRQKILTRGILTSKSSLCKNNVAKSDKDIIVNSPMPSIDYPDWAISEYVWKDFSQWSHKTALVDGITERSITYGQLRDRCRALAIRLQTVLQLNYGDTIAVCLPNLVDFPTICLAANEAGMIVTTVNPIYTAEEISRQLKSSGAKVIFGLARFSKTLEEAVKLTEKSIKIIYVKIVEAEPLPSGGVDLQDLVNTTGIDLNSLKAYENRDPHEIAMLPYSSGTTGPSKGVMLSQRNIVSNMMMMNSNTGNGCLTYPAVGDHQDILPCVLPFFHIYGYTCTLLSLMAKGCKLITLPNFAPDTYLNVLEKHKPMIIHVVPPIVSFLTHSDKVESKHTKSIKFVMSGAAGIAQADVEKFNAKIPNQEFLQGYGLTEASPVGLVLIIGEHNYTSIGHPLPDTEAKIVPIDDPEMRGAGQNVTGELWIRGPQVMKGYLHNEKATKETITPDGWLRTGDIGHYDEKEMFYITDRLKELIKVKGFQVPPAELEEILRSHPDIADAAVIGIPDERSGEIPRAYVVSKNSKISEKDVKEYVAKKVAKYKRLEGGVEFITAIPKNNTGKVLRRELKKKYEST